MDIISGVTRMRHNNLFNKTSIKNISLKVMAAMFAAAVLFTGCGSDKNSNQADQPENNQPDVKEQTTADTAAAQQENKEPVEITVLAAASLTDVCDEIKVLYEKENPNVTLTFSYGGSGALQTQIEEGAPADIFISAATKQMTALNDKGLMDSGSIINLLENKVVLIVPAGSTAEVASFDDVVTDKVKMIGLGEPGSVPVGQYSEEIFTTLGTLEEVKAKANYGSDVRTVLSWVETSAVDCGVVYATDAYTTDKVKIVCEAPKGSCKQVIYPAGIVKSSANPEEAARFIEYLQSEEIMKLFESYGFSRAE